MVTPWGIALLESVDAGKAGMTAPALAHKQRASPAARPSLYPESVVLAPERDDIIAPHLRKTQLLVPSGLASVPWTAWTHGTFEEPMNSCEGVLIV